MATTFVPWLAAGTGHLELAAALARSVTVRRIQRDAASAAQSAAFSPA
jgi:hypothetical protein